MIIITVHGTPVQQGSKTIAYAKGPKGRRPVLRDANANELKTWRRQIVNAAKIALHPHQPWTPYDGPVHVTINYTFRRPQHHYRTGRHADQLRDDAPTYRHQTPDRDKLDRAINDALTEAGVWTDDAVNVAGSSTKGYCDRDDTPGATITITPIIPPGMLNLEEEGAQ